MTEYAGYFEFLTENVIGPFWDIRFSRLLELELEGVLKRKNPYLFKAKNIVTAEEYVRSLLDAHISSQEETLFGNLLERFAVHVSSLIDGGIKSRRKSIDLEFVRDDMYYIVGIKSGTNWGNSDQVNKMRENFKSARADLKEEGVIQEIVAVNGCMYGTENVTFKVHRNDPEKNYYKYAGQEFWEFISRDQELYQQIIKPIGEIAKARDPEFKDEYAKKVNLFTQKFLNEFMADGQIDWRKVLEAVSKKSSGKEPRQARLL